MANGRVLTGFSKPYVALYSATGTTVSYASTKILARGVSVSIAPDSATENKFYADNIVAESSGGMFTGGTVTLTVDGLKDDASKMIFGLPTATKVDSVDVYEYGDNQQIPFVGIGFVARYMEDGVTSYVPYILTKCRFNTESLSATTQGDSVEFQTQELTATILRDDSANHNWKKVGAEQTTEANAIAVITKILA